jgi:hypothetical protein
MVAGTGAPRRRKRPIECHVMRLLALALTLSLADLGVPSAQTVTLPRLDVGEAVAC